MLSQLSISNYAIIEQLTIRPGANLNIVTGETGAGKSIILGALSLILGERADTSVLINKEQKCVVEATFETEGNDAFTAALGQHELDQEHPCIIRREISSSGKSRAFINDTPVTLSVLHELTALLVDLHQQFDNHSIEDEDFQVSVLDTTAGNKELYTAYKDQFLRYQSLQKSLNEKKALQDNWQKEADYKQFLFDELEQASFKPGEIEDAEQQIKRLASAEKILGVLQQARYLLDEGEQPIATELRRQAQQLQSVTDLMPEIAPLFERLQSSYAEIKDIANELGSLEDKVSLNPEQMALLQERFDLGVRLQKKHAVPDTEGLLRIWSDLAEELKGTLNLQEEIATLETALNKAAVQLQNTGEQLSKARKKAAPDLGAQITRMLADVGMPNAVFSIQVAPAAKPGIYGLDQVAFLLDANKSGNFQPVGKAASGGEKSRIALCIKTLIAQAIHLPTLIFDEVDTGISGEAARKVGGLLHELARFRQVICITHQPQVAARGATNFYVYKEASGSGKINTNVRILNPEEKVLAIARMIGGEQPSEAAISNARELITE
ncbi:DNA repair protein RecN [Rurimicrobium arvi]|uniref:DNA repair protein RecN n=1 Tax=Rurimicrobium arvi TaxID=2049916 RepID=A0ABP8MWM0_9BACT